MSNLVTLEYPSPVERIATITLNSPHNRNALSRQLLSELASCLSEASTNSDIHGVLIRSGSRVFCSGADLTEAQNCGIEQSARALMSIQRQIMTLQVPVVVRVDGPVRAGGLGILASSDIVITCEDATFAFSEAKLGLAPAVVSATVLPAMTARSAALTFLTAGVFDGRAAQDWGLATLSVQKSELDAAVRGVLIDIASCTKQGLRESKAVLNADTVRRIDSDGARLVETSAGLFASEDARTAIAGFMN